MFGRILECEFNLFVFTTFFSSLTVGIVVSLDSSEIVVELLLTFNVGNSATEGA